MKKEVPASGVGMVYTEEEIALVADVMRHTRDTLTQGKYQSEFEKKFCAYNGSEHAFAVATGTSALKLAAMLCRFKPGDEVIMPAHTFCASAIPFAQEGVKLIWADIDPDTWVVSAKTIESKITPRTRCIVVVHLYGLAANMPEIMALAKKHKILVVEDCAQAFGAESCGKKVGSWGDIGCFSFHTHKNITTLGEGGMLTVKDPELAKVVPGLRHNGIRPFPGPRDRYWVPAMSNVDFDWDGVWPYNFCIGEVQCALGARLLDRIDHLNKGRVERRDRFVQAVKDFPELVFQKIPKAHTTSAHLLPARYDGKKFGKTNHDFIDKMFNEYQVKMIVQYHPLYRYPMFKKAGFGEAHCPETDRLFDNMVSFPFQSWMPEDQFDYMAECTIKTLKSLRSSKGEK